MFSVRKATLPALAGMMAILGFGQVAAEAATATIPIGQTQVGVATYYNDAGQFASTDPTTTPGVLNVTWQFVSTNGNGGTTPPATATGQITGLAGKCIGAAGGTLTNGTAIDLYSCVGSPTQQWTMATDGTIQNSGKFMDVAGGATTNGTKVQIYDCNGTAAQQWTYTSGHDLVNPQSNKCLDLTNNSAADFTPVQLWTCTNTSSQKWVTPA